MLTFHSDKHKFFDELLPFICGLSACGIAFISSGDTTKVISADATVTLYGSPKGINQGLIFNPNELLKSIHTNKWPTLIEINELPVPFERESSNRDIYGILKIVEYMAQAAFIQYYEKVVYLIRSKYGGDPLQWPPVLNFARVIRNAFSHGGKIHFDNKVSYSVNWRTLTYSYADQDREIMYKDISAVEIIYLMQDMDELIP
ncbi:MAG TPA: hypothetical protein VJG90_01985 [Candidatus Nanoarchaeia archaeon]|nr:hypothetical protein [Candidatus Nanoarchaeia archaeon]